MVGLPYLQKTQNIFPNALSLLRTGLLRGNKWDRTEEAVAWEALSASTYSVPSGVDACLCIYRKSSSDLRRHAEAEATLHRESYALRHAIHDYRYSPSGPEGNRPLILSAPHSIQSVVLEENQATIRIMAQRINLGWLSLPNPLTTPISGGTP